MVRLTADQGGPRQGTPQRDTERQDEQQGSGTRPGDEPVPLSERGGARPLETDPDDYNDRTRDRELDQNAG